MVGWNFPVHNSQASMPVLLQSHLSLFCTVSHLISSPNG